MAADPRPINLTEAEKSELTPDQLKRHKGSVEQQMYGPEVKRDRHGHPVEQGIGSKGHETLNHFIQLREAEKRGQEAAGTYEAAVAEIWKRDPTRAKAIGLREPRKAAAA